MATRVAAVAVGGGSGVSIGHRSSSSACSSRSPLLAPSPPPLRLRRLLENPPRAAAKSASAAPKGFGSAAKNKKSSATTEKGTAPTPPWVADASACPCCSGRKFDACCSPFLSRAASPQTAEQLMRSRFAAYVKKNAEYIIETTHPENRAAAGSRRPDGTVASSLAQDVAATIKRVSWQRLKVEAVEGGGRCVGGVGKAVSFFYYFFLFTFSLLLPRHSPKRKKQKLAPPFRDDDEGFVTFTTWFKVTGQQGSRQDGGDAVGTMSERSLFVRVPLDDEGGGGGEGGGGAEESKRGRWMYREGTPVINGVPRILS